MRLGDTTLKIVTLIYLVYTKLSKILKRTKSAKNDRCRIIEYSCSISFTQYIFIDHANGDALDNLNYGEIDHCVILKRT